MKHVELLETKVASGKNRKDLLRRATGRFYTPHLVARSLAIECVGALGTTRPVLKVLDPFCGDGRLVSSFIEALTQMDRKVRPFLECHLWDRDSAAVSQAAEAVTAALQQHGIVGAVSGRCWDTFLSAQIHNASFDVVITNPPWETLKPDARELSGLGAGQEQVFKDGLALWADELRLQFPASCASAQFSRSVSLSRCGTELALGLLAPHGVCGIVCPAPLLADQASAQLRRLIFTKYNLLGTHYYPAETRLFESVDQSFITMLVRAETVTRHEPVMIGHNPDTTLAWNDRAYFPNSELAELDYILPAQRNPADLPLLSLFGDHPTWSDHEGGLLWAGRELDETDSKSWLQPSGDHPFLRGRMISRYGSPSGEPLFVDAVEKRIPSSVSFSRVVWRDVSRPSQYRRMTATSVDPGWVCGNSLGVAHVRSEDSRYPKALAAIMNSFCFEFQLRTFLATGHVSLGTVRRCRVPTLTDERTFELAATFDVASVAGTTEAVAASELAVARVYGLSRDDMAAVLRAAKATEIDTQAILTGVGW